MTQFERCFLSMVLGSDLAGVPMAHAAHFTSGAQTAATFLAYHSHATADERTARVKADKAARLQIDLRKAKGTFAVEWFRAQDGVAKHGGTIEGGQVADLIAPGPTTTWCCD